MTRWIMAAALMFFVPYVPLARGGQQQTWDGPPCHGGAATFKVCSKEPAVPDDPLPCYVSHFANYIPDPVQIKLVKLCQAAKVALSSAPADRSAALSAVTSMALDLNAEVNDDSQDGLKNADALRLVGQELVSLGSRESAWGLSPSEDTWDDVSDNLVSLTEDAEVWGG